MMRRAAWGIGCWVVAVAAAGCQPATPAEAPALLLEGAPIGRGEFVEALLADQGEAFAKRFAARRLIEAEAKAAGISVVEAELDQRLEAEIRRLTLQRFAGSAEKFTEHIRSYGVSVETWRRNRRLALHTELLAARLMRHTVPEEQARALFEQRFGAGGVSRDVRHLLVSTQVATSRQYTREAYREELPALERAAREEAEVLRRRLLAGEDFAALAKERSDDFSAPRGGDLGAEWSGRYGKSFDDVVAKLRVGEISPVVQSKRGFHVIQATGRRRGAEYFGRVIKVSVGQGDEAGRSARLAEARQKVLGLRQRIVDGEPFAAVAEASSDDLSSRAKGGVVGPFGPGLFGPEVDPVLETLPLGELSRPLEVDDGFVLLQLDRRQFLPARDTLLVRHILLGTGFDQVKARKLGPELEARAEALAQALLQRAASEDFDALAREASEDPLSRLKGGRLAPFVAGSLGAEVDQALSEMKPGEVRLVRTTRGFQIVRLEAARQADFEQVKVDLIRELREKPPTPEEIGAWIKARAEAAKIELRF